MKYILSVPRILCAAVFAFSILSFPMDARESDLLDSLTLEQKVAQMFMVSLYGSQMTDWGRDFLQTWLPGGVILFSSNAGTPESVTSLTNAFQQTVVNSGGLPLFIAVDQEGGIIAHLKDGFTTWPVPMLVTATGDTALAVQVGQGIAQELRAVGVNMNLAPVADLLTNPDNPVIGRRAFGSDPQLTGQMVAAFIDGMQTEGVIATAKHFPGHGDTVSDSHLSLPVIDYDRQHLESVEFVPFEKAIDVGVESIMVAHIWFPALEPQQNLPASLSPNVITKLLRGEMGYHGLVLTDALEMDAIDTVYGYDEAAVMAVQAGVDLITFGGHTGLETQASAIQAVIDAVQRGDISETRIDEAVRRIIDVKQRYDILDWQPLDVESASSRIDRAAHETLVSEVFQAGTTLVMDKYDRIPLTVDQSIAVIYPANRSLIKRECGQYGLSVDWLGVSDSPTERDIAWAAGDAAQSDVVVVFTQSADEDRSQQALVNALPPEKTIVVALWSPYDLLDFPDVSAYLATYSPLDPAVTAACSILSGASSPRGVLPVALGDSYPAGTHSQ
jgi:beta-N-acetylhexosaminidase